MAQDRTIPEFDQKLDTLGENELHALLRRIACAIVDLAPDSGADAIEEIEAAFDAHSMQLDPDYVHGRDRKVWQFALVGYDARTSDTDHMVKWVVAPNVEAVHEVVGLMGWDIAEEPHVIDIDPSEPGIDARWSPNG
jgi:hypothetical protein